VNLRPARPCIDRPAITPKDSHSSLTAREIQVATLTARGMGEKEIANELSISPATVRVHIENIKRRLHAENKTHAIAILMAKNLISLD